jgi:alkylated DNA repair dioxygenase AlkB
LERIWLDPSCWVDHAPGWLSGSDELFAELLAGLPWDQRCRRIYDRELQEPRLTASWNADAGQHPRPPVLDTARQVLSSRFGVTFDSVGFNLYRDGHDSVAWHRDRIPKRIRDPIVALLSLGERRRFLLRPFGRGPSRAFMLGRGDLLVTGGRTQREWEHSVPKVSSAGPRISVAFRHGMSATSDGAPDSY